MAEVEAQIETRRHRRGWELFLAHRRQCETAACDAAQRRSRTSQAALQGDVESRAAERESGDEERHVRGDILACLLTTLRRN